MENLMFVHGASANEKSWFDIPSQFENDHHVEVVRLAGHDRPRDSEPDFSITMKDYMKSIQNAMGTRKNWILIGHSMGGMVISQFAADHPDTKFPDLVKKLVYVTALLPRDGETASSLLDINSEQGLALFLANVKIRRQPGC